MVARGHVPCRADLGRGAHRLRAEHQGAHRVRGLHGVGVRAVRRERALPPGQLGSAQRRNFASA
ncbi:hypothetical protein SCOCK_240112 [Actinacidiphila cocklensis]|uniref:Uncharacterized protein n=1 Tax=Actinacidiphila cocklensis TaxID=887465 RepID=A0A9W4DMI0_9ACTN|nr:hypothetical protein SCOCK_240112 [Actinacidiphila cocklensis]